MISNDLIVVSVRRPSETRLVYKASLLLKYMDVLNILTLEYCICHAKGLAGKD